MLDLWSQSSSAVRLVTPQKQVSKQLPMVNARTKQEAGDRMHCILVKCLHLKKTISLPRSSPLPTEISVQWTCYISDDTANCFMSIPTSSQRAHLSFHSIPCTVVRGIHRHQLQHSEVHLLTPPTANERKKILSRMIRPFPSNHPVIPIAVK